MAHDDLKNLMNAVRELQIKLAREIERSRRLRDELGLSEDALKTSGERMENLLARIRTKRTVH